jgi:hypothetical protein
VASADLATFFQPAPSSPLGPAGEPRYGGYFGSLERADLAPLAGQGVKGLLTRTLRRKRWQWGMVATDEVLAAMAIVDAGYAAFAFAFAADRAAGTMLFDRKYPGLPGLSAAVGDRPGIGARAFLDLPGRRLAIERRGERYHLSAALGGTARLDCLLDTRGAPAPFALVAPVPGGAANVTQKAGALPASGTLECRGRTFSLDGGFGGLDYTQGILARRTRWRWAFAAGRHPDGSPLSFNLVEGFNAGEVTENVVFRGAGPAPLPACAFRFEDGPTSPCRIASADGRVDLLFRPGPGHREQMNLLLVRSRFFQVSGSFAGRVPGPGGRELAFESLPGVVEDQDVTW